MKTIKSQSLTQKPILALAPMAGYTDSAFRLVCLENGADLVYTEMISSEGLARQSKKTLHLLKFLPAEKNIVVQLFGKNPEAFAKAVHLLCNNKYFNSSSRAKRWDPIVPHSLCSLGLGITNKIVGIDINLGCPAKKVFKTGAGAALMDNKYLAREIISTVLKNTTLPVSIKIRSQVKNTTAEEFINFVKDLDFKTVMIHGRTLNQGMSGAIDFEMIKKVKNLLLNKVVLGNGDIDSLEKVQEMLEKTKVDGVGIGRGSFGKPWIFNEIKKNKPLTISAKNKILTNTILHHAKLFLQQNENLIPLRKHLIWYFKAQKNASEVRQAIIKVETLADLKSILGL